MCVCDVAVRPSQSWFRQSFTTCERCTLWIEYSARACWKSFSWTPALCMQCSPAWTSWSGYIPIFWDNFFCDAATACMLDLPATSPFTNWETYYWSRWASWILTNHGNTLRKNLYRQQWNLLNCMMYKCNQNEQKAYSVTETCICVLYSAFRKFGFSYIVTQL